MSNDVDICNTALGYLGDAANVTSISPPDQSAQARHCARFYPMVLKSAQEMHHWNFGTHRSVLTLISPLPAPNVNNQWNYVYALPNVCLNAIKVMDLNAPDDWSIGVGPEQARYWNPSPQLSTSYTRVPFVREALADGTEVICTDQQDALLMHTVLVTDPNKFTGLFVEVLAALLASKLAGPIVKGKEGRALAQEWMQAAMAILAKAQMQDANNRSISQIEQSTPWVQMR